MDNKDETPKLKGRKNVFYVGLLSFFGGISQDVFAPILPIYLTSVLGFDKTFVGIAEGVVTASSNIFKVAAGYFSDKFKKQKPIIFIGYFLSMVGRPLIALFTSGTAILGLRLIDGVGKGVKDPPKDVLIAGSAEKATRGKSFGIARMLDTLGSVAGPLILFMLLYFLKESTFLYHWILLFATVPLVITLFVLIAKVKELDHKTSYTITFVAKFLSLWRGEAKISRHIQRIWQEIFAKPQPKEGNYSRKVIVQEVFSQIQEKSGERVRGALPASFYIFLGITILFTLGNSSDAFLILRAKNVGITLLEIPIVIALFNLVYALAAVPLGSLSDKIGRVPTMLLGWFAYALVYLGFAMTTHAWFIWALYGFYGIYYATNQGVAKAFLADIVGPEYRGRAFGIYGTTIGIATLPASFLAGFLWDSFGPQIPFYFGATIAGLAALLLFIFSKRLKVV